MLSIQSLLSSISPILSAPKVKVKLVRHKDNRLEYREQISNREGLLEYQKKQANSTFHECDYIVSFTGASIFLGVFKVNGWQTVTNGYLGEEYFGDDINYYYDLEEIDTFKEFNDRVVIDWGNAPLAWNQWYDNIKEVTQILPKEYLGAYFGAFPGLTKFILSYDELKKLIQNPVANMDWKAHLSAVNGIYLILDRESGKQYIGSAYGQNGVWQRWESYVIDPTGGNSELINLKQERPDFYNQLSFALLEALPSNYSKEEVIAVEQLCKEKFGTRVHGLNAN